VFLFFTKGLIVPSQYCGSGIRCFFDLWIRDWKKFWIQDEHPDSFFRQLQQFFGLKILKIFDADADPGSGIRVLLDP
jgi:hypothetical protein